MTSRSGSNSGSTIVNDVLTVYDGWGNVAASYQDHAGAATTSDPGVVYHYADGASGDEAGYVRLDQVTYPDGRTAEYAYGSGGSITDRLDLVAGIASTKGANTATVASYTCLGAGTIVKTERPSVTGGLTLSYGAAGDGSGAEHSLEPVIPNPDSSGIRG